MAEWRAQDSLQTNSLKDACRVALGCETLVPPAPILPRALYLIPSFLFQWVLPDTLPITFWSVAFSPLPVTYGIYCREHSIAGIDLGSGTSSLLPASAPL